MGYTMPFILWISKLLRNGLCAYIDMLLRLCSVKLGIVYSSSSNKQVKWEKVIKSDKNVSKLRKSDLSLNY